MQRAKRLRTDGDDPLRVAVLTELTVEGEPGDDGAGEWPKRPADRGMIGGVDSGDGSTDESSYVADLRVRSPASPDRLDHSGCAIGVASPQLSGAQSGSEGAGRLRFDSLCAAAATSSGTAVERAALGDAGPTRAALIAGEVVREVDVLDRVEPKLADDDDEA